MYTFEQLKEDVRKEAEALRIHATKEERERLNFGELNPEFIGDCIYGQMTGNCYSERASILIGKCAFRYVKDGSLTNIKHEGFNRIAYCINGTQVDDLHANRNSDDEPPHYSAIEAYILLPEAQNANLIAYLRGETDTLTL
jgi:hypothetical protein